MRQGKQITAVSQQVFFNKDMLPWQAKHVWQSAETGQLRERSDHLRAKNHLFGDHLPLGNCTIKTDLRSKLCHSIHLLNDSADHLKI